MWIPDDRHLYRLLTDWGGVIAGILALVAAAIAYRGALRSAREQMAANATKDNLQAECIAAGISNEIDHLKGDIARVRAIIREQMPYDSAFEHYKKPIVERRRDLQIDDPPLIRENVLQLFLLGKTGAVLLELRSHVLQHNRLVADVDPTGPLEKLDDRLKTMESLVESAQGGL